MVVGVYGQIGVGASVEFTSLEHANVQIHHLVMEDNFVRDIHQNNEIAAYYVLQVGISLKRRKTDILYFYD